MHLKAVIAAIAATTISNTLAAPVAAIPLARRTLPPGVENRLQEANDNLAGPFCYGENPRRCYNPTTNPAYVSDSSNHGYGYRVDEKGTQTFNYGARQFGIHSDGSQFYKDTNGNNCDVSYPGGPKGDGCAEFLYLTGGGDVIPGTLDQCYIFGLC